MSTTFIVFTDGSSTVYKNKNGIRFGGVGVFIEGYPEHNLSLSLSGEHITNQKAELLACIEAIKKCSSIAQQKGLLKWSMIIYSDSMYTIKCATEWAPKWEANGWKRKVGGRDQEVLNLKYVQELYKLVNKVNIKFIHVRSHQIEPSKNDPTWKLWYGNKIADELAGNAMLIISNQSNI